MTPMDFVAVENPNQLEYGQRTFQTARKQNYAETAPPYSFYDENQLPQQQDPDDCAHVLFQPFTEDGYENVGQNIDECQFTNGLNGPDFNCNSLMAAGVSSNVNHSLDLNSNSVLTDNSHLFHCYPFNKAGCNRRFNSFAGLEEIHPQHCPIIVFLPVVSLPMTESGQQPTVEQPVEQPSISQRSRQASPSKTKNSRSRVSKHPLYCPHRTCERHTKAFSRRDNMLVHRRTVHKEKI